MEKNKIYALYAKVEGTPDEEYTINDGINEYLKRGQTIFYHETLKGLDTLTSKYTSFGDINQTFQSLYNSTKNMRYPVIYADEINNNGQENMFYTTDVVYYEDAKELENEFSIEQWLLDYLKSNPENIKKFRIIGQIYEDVKNYYKTGNVEFWINKTVSIYITKEGYKGYREAYFKLKELDPERTKKYII